MKHSTRILSLLLLISVTLFLVSCDDGDDKKKSDNKDIDLLVGTWKAGDVTYGGTVQADYSDFTLTLVKSGDQLSYTATGRPSDKNGPWPGSGTLSFASEAGKLIRLGDNLNITYSVSGSQLSMSFNYTGIGHAGGRTESIEGDWVFNLTKQ